MRRTDHYLRAFCVVACLAISTLAAASEYDGRVTFGGLPVPGVTITATQGSKKFTTITDQQGVYSFPDLADGTWTIEVEMLCFSTIKQDVVIAPNGPAAQWELKLPSLDQIRAETKPALSVSIAAPLGKSEPSKPPDKAEQAAPPDNKLLPPEAPQDDLAQRAADGFLINGSVNNGAASPFAQLAAFGNNRIGGKGLYNGGIGLIFDNSALDARPFSLSGQSTPKAAYNVLTGVATLGGPLNIPHLLRHGPNFFVGYQWTRNRNATTQSALVPGLAERGGDLSQALNPAGQPLQIFNPATGLPFAGNAIPVSPQAQALLKLYPLPNVVGNPRYNYQIPIVGNTHQDALQSRLNKALNQRNQLFGDFNFQSTRTGSPNLFGFLDTTDALGINTGINWSHRFNQGRFLNLGYRFNRLATRVTPSFENRENVSGKAGISGNNQDPANWGPPSLSFSSGVAGLSDAQSSFDRNQTSVLSYSMSWNHERHFITFGGDFRRQQFNHLSQQDPRGTFTFTGAATQGSANGIKVGGSDFADFLLGVPDASSIAFGNADKYFRESVYDAYITDDWRLSPTFTVNAGIRWEYGAPITELHGRLVNLDIASGFSAVAPTLASHPVGPLTGQRYPDSLVRPDKSGFEPRVGIAWRPNSGASMVVRAGYGIYRDTSVYQTIALQMAQQAPLSKSLSVQNSPACPLTLANGFNSCPSVTSDTYAVDPNFRVGYAHNWQVSVQRDLPRSLQLTATYLGIKGARGVQEFLPNTFPIGATNSCSTCPAGFAYLTSNGNSTRESGQIQLRRRLHNGFTATVQYAFSKSVDDVAALGGGSFPKIAQNWLDLRAERGPSPFDQRHLLTAQVQYTTGMGLGGKTLWSGWKGTTFKEWTFLNQITVGSGLPQTPIYLATVQGTGVTGSIRPDNTGAPLYEAPSGLFLNPAAYRAPRPGQWGNAGRNSIIGPGQFTLNASMSRTFRLHGRYNLDLRMDFTNPLNHVAFSGWNTIVNSTQFGLPATANPMRSMQTTLRLRF